MMRRWRAAFDWMRCAREERLSLSLNKESELFYGASVDIGYRQIELFHDASVDIGNSKANRGEAHVAKLA